ncbi:hypothetical protein [Pedobacter frigiditerrae]|uniref:hypothetical protein n=1 Tax=Pedobacter frigiditerrae TaxID=2530452 RepID=UPI002931D108|nr:hypothetical protein [Pedobacter frigiditerrae]
MEYRLLKKMTIKILALLFTMPFFCSCISIKQEQEDISCIELSYSIPIYKAGTTELIQLNDTLLIYYKQKNILIREFYKSTTYNNKAIRNGEFVISNDEQTILNTNKKIRNYLFTKNSYKGLRYDSISSNNFIVFDIDSLLKKKTFKGSKLYDSTNDILVERKKDNKTGAVFEKYIPRVKFDASYNDTTYFVFAPKFKSINYSLSQEADSLRKMKLVAVKLSYNAKPRTANNLKEVPKRDFLFKIRELKIANPKEILSLFEKFEKDSEKLNLK